LLPGLWFVFGRLWRLGTILTLDLRALGIALALLSLLSLLSDGLLLRLIPLPHHALASLLLPLL
jgi:hypothetical protein